MRIKICLFQSHAVSIFMPRKVRIQKDVHKTWVPTTCSGDSNVGHNENTYKLVPVQVSKATYQGIVICCLWIPPRSSKAGSVPSFSWFTEEKVKLREGNFCRALQAGYGRAGIQLQVSSVNASVTEHPGCGLYSPPVWASQLSSTSHTHAPLTDGAAFLSLFPHIQMVLKIIACTS